MLNFTASSAVKIYYCPTPVNLHRSFDGLPGIVRQILGHDPLDGSLYVFFNRRFNSTKILCNQNEKGARESALESNSETSLFRQRKRCRKQSAPVVEQYFALCREILEKEPPSSAIAKAAAYSLNQEQELKKFLENPKLNIDNNPCENIIRPFCIGRKNWLFVENEGGGTSMAVLASFAATCKEVGVDFEAWLNDILPRLDTCPAAEVRTLLPHIWKNAR